MRLASLPKYRTHHIQGGRIERFWGTCQDRLVSELRLSGASTLEEANKVLLAFLDRYNQQFIVAATEAGSAYRSAEGLKLDDFFCFKHQRMVSADNAVRFSQHWLQVLPPNGRRSYTGAKVEVREATDGRVSVYYHLLPNQPAPPEASLPRGGQPNIPAPNHPGAPGSIRQGGDKVTEHLGVTFSLDNNSCQNRLSIK